jgi:proteasome lid subunit RPN8/RPN11
MVLQAEAVEAILKHAVGEYPEECCGAMVGVLDGERRLVHGAWPLAHDAPARDRRFAVAPADYRRLEQRAQESGVDLVGFYHSHPDAPAAPSDYDLAHAWPHFSYVIVSVQASTPVAITSWRLRQDRSEFQSEEITWAHGS